MYKVTYISHSICSLWLLSAAFCSADTVEQTKPGSINPKLPLLSDVIQQISLNNEKVKNGNLAIRSVEITNAAMLRDIGISETSDALLLYGSRISVLRQEFVFAPKKCIVSSNQINIYPKVSTVNISTSWTDYYSKLRSTLVLKEQFLNEEGKVKTANRGRASVKKEAVGAKDKELAFEEVQIGNDKVEIPTDANLVGKMRYRGLECLDIRWREEGSQISVREIICPGRDYRTLYKELFTVSSNNTKIIHKYGVEKMQQLDGIWIPTQVRVEHQRTYANGSVGSQVKKSWISQFKPNSLTPDSLFTPLLPPGIAMEDVSLNGTGTGLIAVSMTGGDAKPTVERLRKGDFSLLEEDTQDIQ